MCGQWGWRRVTSPGVVRFGGFPGSGGSLVFRRLVVMIRRRHFRSAIGLMSFLVAVLALTVHASAEWKEKVLYSFQGSPDGSFPGGGVVFDKAGNLYGVTVEGGSGSCPPAQCGIVYRLSPPAQKGGPWTETVLYVFKGQHYGDGSSPAGTLIIDSSGNLYGATGYGGTGQCMIFGGVVGCGTVYELSPPKKQGEAWTEKVLYSFKGDKDGQLAGETLTFDGHGNIYGATAYGGGYGSCNEPYYQHCGAIYELSPPQTKGGKWTEKVLYGFKSGKDGANPNGGLVFDAKDAIYGTTQFGGYHQGQCDRGVGYEGCGTVFALKPPAKEGGDWSESVHHRFEGSPRDGLGPNGCLAQGKDGSLYGTTIGGGSDEDGVVFRLIPSVNNRNSWKESLIHVFTGAEDGQGPWAGLVQGPDGNFYGSAGGSPSRGGVVFRMRPPALTGGVWSFDVLYSFTGSPDGYDPLELTIVKGGVIFGVTAYGGTGQACQGGCGTVFEISP
jgi:uncharacterized repeat protein (TIGR03803 family)